MLAIMLCGSIALSYEKEDCSFLTPSVELTSFITTKTSGNEKEQKEMHFLAFSYLLYLIGLLLPQSIQSHMQTIFEYSNEYNENHEIMQKIVNQCFSDMIGSFVAIGNWANDNALFLRTVQTDSKSVYLFDAKVNHLQNYKTFQPFTKINQTLVETKVYPASNVTIAVSSEDTLVKLLHGLKESIWWNHEAHFLIFNDNYETGCTVARQFLQVVWDFDILSVTYFCFNTENEVYVYTFNPYDRLGSEFWREAWTSREVDNYWTIFEHSFDESFISNNETLNCNYLNLGVTKNLNQLRIKLGGKEIKRLLPLGTLKREVINDLDIFRVMLKTLNATYTFKTYPEFGVNENSGPTGYLKDIESGKLQAGTNLMLLQGFWKHQTYPREFNSHCLITPKNVDTYNFASFTVNEWPVLAAVSVVSIIIIKCVFRRSYSKTLLEFIRILTGGSFLNEASRPRDHFFLINSMLAVATITLCLQTYVTTYNVIPNAVRQIDSLDDLIDTELMLFGSKGQQNFLYQKEILEKFEIETPLKCLNDIVAGQRKACLVYCVALKAKDYSEYIHEAKELLTSRPSAFPVAPNWPLLSKLNKILSYLAESGVYQFTSVTYQALKWGLPKIQSEAKSISLEQLRFSFNLLFGGYCLATLAFLIELCFNKIPKF